MAGTSTAVQSWEQEKPNGFFQAGWWSQWAASLFQALMLPVVSALLSLFVLATRWELNKTFQAVVSVSHWKLSQLQHTKNKLNL